MRQAIAVAWLAAVSPSTVEAQVGVREEVREELRVAALGATSYRLAVGEPAGGAHRTVTATPGPRGAGEALWAARTCVPESLTPLLVGAPAGVRSCGAPSGAPGAAIRRDRPEHALAWGTRQREPDLLGWAAVADTARPRMPRFWRAAIGAAAGATIGAVAGSAYGRRNCGELIPCGEQAVENGLVWGTVGFVVGGLVGAMTGGD